MHNQIRDPEKTTFVCVCIPEFLSIYETERLVQELSKSEIDTHNVVVNQVLFPDKDAEDLVEWYSKAKDALPQEAQDLIGKTIARKRMQDRYISQIFELYEDFHIVLMPLLDNEVLSPILTHSHLSDTVTCLGTWRRLVRIILEAAD